MNKNNQYKGEESSIIMRNIKNIIEYVKSIQAKEKIREQEKFIRGEKFNIFDVIGISTYEVSLHSALLAELFNPHGGHGVKDSFLKEFIALIPEKFSSCISSFDTELATIKKEVYIGSKTDDSGGRLDILIESDDKAILIENKIYANDQKNQMHRYYNYAKNRYKGGFILIYLTLYGDDASEESLTDLTEDKYLRLSYKQDIYRWINSCIRIATLKPLVRETLNQYLQTIKKITYMTIDDKKIFINYLATKDNIEALATTMNNIEDVKNQIISEELQPQLVEMAKKLKLVYLVEQDENWSEIYSSFTFKNSIWSRYSIIAQFEKKNFSNMIIGLHHDEQVRCKRVHSKLSKLFAKQSNTWVWDDFRYKNWDLNTMVDIYNGNLVKAFEEVIINILNSVKDYSDEM